MLTRTPRTLALLVLLALLAIDGTPAAAFPRDRCRRAADCSGGGPQFCLADDVASTVGRCVAGKVLP